MSDVPDMTMVGRIARAPTRAGQLATTFGNIARAIERLNKAVAMVATLAIFAMTLSTSADITMRFLVNQPILGVTELNELLMVFAVYLGIAYTQTMKGHVQMELVIEHLPKKAKLVLEILVYLMVIAGFILFVRSSGEQAIRAWTMQEYRFGSTRFPLWPSKALVPIGVGLLTLQLIIDVVRDIARLFGHAAAERPAESPGIELVPS